MIIKFKFMTNIKFIVFTNLLHWKIIGKYDMLNLNFDKLSFLILQKPSRLLVPKMDF